MATPTQLETLAKALSADRLPFCSGAISSPPEGLHLWYNNKNPRFIDFASPTSKDLDLLAAASDSATFGRKNPDGSHHSAVGIDASCVSTQFDLTSSGLIGTVQGELLQSETENACIRAKPHKLNVYDQHLSFKADENAPQETDKFGTLMIIYPTAREGGELALRHDGLEWEIDPNHLVVSQSSPSLAYVAFLSDVEHEVLHVASGRTVILTYHLYFVDRASKLETPALTPNSKNNSNFQTTLKGLLESPEFLPSGGPLAFGLVGLYPVTTKTKLQEIASYLKGEDARVYQACQGLGLKPSIRMICDDTYNGGNGQFGIMLNEIDVDSPDDERWRDDCFTYEDHLASYGVLVNKYEGVELSDDCIQYHEIENQESESITWVTPLNTRTRLEICWVHSSPCILVRVPEASKRM